MAVILHLPRCKVTMCKVILHLPHCKVTMTKVILHLPRCKVTMRKVILHLPRCNVTMRKVILHLPHCKKVRFRGMLRLHKTLTGLSRTCDGSLSGLIHETVWSYLFTNFFATVCPSYFKLKKYMPGGSWLTGITVCF